MIHHDTVSRQRRNDLEQFLGASSASCKSSIISSPFHFHLEEKTRAAAVQAQTYEAKVLLCRGVMKCHTAMHGNVVDMSDMPNRYEKT